MIKYKRLILKEPMIIFLMGLTIPVFLIIGINRVSIGNMLIWSIIVFFFKGHEFNYFILSKNELIICNFMHPWRKKIHFKIDEIEHIDFGRPIGILSGIFIKVLSNNRFSKRYYIRLMSDKQINSFVKTMNKNNIPTNKKGLAKIIDLDERI